MQLTLRDFLWLTVVIGLVIGIVLEHRDVRALSAYRGKAEWWEKAARNLGEHYEQKTGIRPEFHEMGEIEFRRSADGMAIFDDEFLRRDLHVSSTRELPGDWPTGHFDLNQILVCLIVYVCLMGIFAFIQRRFPNWRPKTQSKQTAPAANYCLRVLVIIFVVISVGAFALRYPFAGTAYLFIAAQLSVFILPREFVSRFIILPALPESHATSVEA